MLRDHGLTGTAPTTAAGPIGPRRLSMAEAVAEGRIRVMQSKDLDRGEGGDGEGSRAAWDAAFADSVPLLIEGDATDY